MEGASELQGAGSWLGSWLVCSLGMESRIRALFTSLIFHALLPDVTCFSIYFSSCLVFFALLSNFLLSPFSLCLFCSHRDVSDAAGPPWPSRLRTPPCWAPWLWGAATTPTTTWNASSWTSSNGHAPPRASVRLSHGWVGSSHLPRPHVAFLQLLLSHLLSPPLPYFSFLDFFSLSPCLSSLCIVPVWTVSCFLFLLNFSFLPAGHPGPMPPHGMRGPPPLMPPHGYTGPPRPPPYGYQRGPLPPPRPTPRPPVPPRGPLRGPLPQWFLIAFPPVIASQYLFTSLDQSELL